MLYSQLIIQKYFEKSCWTSRMQTIRTHGTIENGWHHKCDENRLYTHILTIDSSVTA